jgi:hypothetical protein
MIPPDPLIGVINNEPFFFIDRLQQPVTFVLTGADVMVLRITLPAL